MWVIREGVSYMQVEVCKVMGVCKGLVRQRGGRRFFSGPACCRGSRDGCGVTAQPSLPATDKAVRHGRQLIPSLLNY